MSKHKKHHSGHTGHHEEVAKAHGHVPDAKPKAHGKFGTGIFAGEAGHDTMAHSTHHAANAHHNMHDGMSPDGELGGYSSMGHSHMGCNEEHCSGSDGSESGEGDMGGEEHGGGESSEG